ncbi:MAG TPA: efflux transporter outer membrane subunit [Candidatus Acidoferrum sp.]|jgi:multidrug efflux system outer membrane protein|nr:efflux transporter outer membrane subunit [Candidatus Acidoferrum sp.]
MRTCIALVATAFLLCGCTMGPNYKRPTVAVPSSYRGTAPGAPAQTQTGFLGDQKWWDVFQDEQLQSLVRTALKQNYDLRIAASRILEARAQLGITRADQFPTVSGGAGITDVRTAQSKFLPVFETSTGQANVSAAWELDFWGKYRRATEAARANLLATECGKQEVASTLVANVAAAYFQLRALDLELEISKRTLDSRQESLRLTQLLANGGSTSLLDVRQAEQLVFTASAEIPALEQQIEQQENFLSILLGQNPGEITRGQTLTEQHQPPEVPPGLPSSLLERRPDIRQAEEQLVAANAEIGVARAAYFPQISLSGSGGFQSSALTNLFTGPAGAWNFGASLTQPIFTAGKISSGVRLAEARQQTATLFYQQSIQGAFRNVSDALVAYRKTREFSSHQRELFESAQDAARLSHMRYNGGVTGYLEVLTNETNSFSAELGLVQARLNELLALVQLYEALGGGWQQ